MKQISKIERSGSISNIDFFLSLWSNHRKPLFNANSEISCVQIASIFHLALTPPILIDENRIDQLKKITGFDPFATDDNDHGNLVDLLLKQHQQAHDRFQPIFVSFLKFEPGKNAH